MHFAVATRRALSVRFPVRSTFNNDPQFEPLAMHPLLKWFVSVVNSNGTIAAWAVKIYKGVFVRQPGSRLALDRLAVLVHQIREAASNMFPEVSPLKSSFGFALGANVNRPLGTLCTRLGQAIKWPFTTPAQQRKSSLRTSNHLNSCSPPPSQSPARHQCKPSPTHISFSAAATHTAK